MVSALRGYRKKTAHHSSTTQPLKIHLDPSLTNTMSSTEFTAALNFLTDAGHLLATAAPETSAFLMRQRGALMFENDLLQSDIQRQHVCSCCGHIMVPGNGSTLKIENKKGLEKRSRPVRRPKKRRQDAAPPSGPTKVLTCGHCGTLTRISLPPPTPISRRKMKKEETTAGSSTLAQTTSLDTPPQQVATANSNSKRRAKSRKAGLQALLDQKHTAQNSRPGLGLSLADFMKK